VRAASRTKPSVHVVCVSVNSSRVVGGPKSWVVGGVGSEAVGGSAKAVARA
jgi:hypothetical protein